MQNQSAGQDKLESNYRHRCFICGAFSWETVSCLAMKAAVKKGEVENEILVGCYR